MNPTEMIRRKMSGLAPPDAATENKIAEYLSVERHHAVHGPAGEADQRARLELCNACEFNKANRCARCGCGSNPRGQIPVRITLAGAACPIGKWGKVNGIGGSIKTAGEAVASVVGTVGHFLKNK